MLNRNTAILVMVLALVVGIIACVQGAEPTPVELEKWAEKSRDEWRRDLAYCLDLTPGLWRTFVEEFGRDEYGTTGFAALNHDGDIIIVGWEYAEKEQAGNLLIFLSGGEEYADDLKMWGAEHCDLGTLGIEH